MQTIYKYEIPIKDEAVVSMPKDAQCLKFAMQAEKLCVWALVDTEAEKEERSFKIFGTGHQLPSNFHVAWGIDDGDYNYCDTVFDRHFVWHIFVKS